MKKSYLNREYEKIRINIYSHGSMCTFNKIGLLDKIVTLDLNDYRQKTKAIDKPSKHKK